MFRHIFNSLSVARVISFFKLSEHSSLRTSLSYHPVLHRNINKGGKQMTKDAFFPLIKIVIMLSLVIIISILYKRNHRQKKTFSLGLSLILVGVCLFSILQNGVSLYRIIAIATGGINQEMVFILALINKVFSVALQTSLVTLLLYLHFMIKRFSDK